MEDDRVRFKPDGRIDYVATYLASWRSDRNRINRLNKSIPRFRSRLRKRKEIVESNKRGVMIP